MSKITKATIKSFIKKNFDNLYIKVESDFNGMTDCVEAVNDDFHKAVKEEYNDYTLGIANAWFVGGSRDYFAEYNDDNFKGYRVSNCCGRFILAVAN